MRLKKKEMGAKREGGEKPFSFSGTEKVRFARGLGLGLQGGNEKRRDSYHLCGGNHSKAHMPEGRRMALAEWTFLIMILRELQGRRK